MSQAESELNFFGRGNKVEYNLPMNMDGCAVRDLTRWASHAPAEVIEPLSN
jgi:hypothetical protein